MTNFNKILSDSINGSKNITSLTLPEAILLLAVHNKKFIEALVENSNSFDLYTSDHHQDFQDLAKYHSLDAEEIQIIETGNIYASKSVFLFNRPDVTINEIQTLVSLCNKRYFNFPPRSKDQLSLLDWIDSNPRASYTREELSDFPVLIPTLNFIYSDISAADRHFHFRTPQYARYTDVICMVQRDSKAMKSIHDVYASLIIADEVITYLSKSINPHLRNSDSEVLKNFLSAVDYRDDIADLSERELMYYLQYSDLNFVLNWIFKSSSLNKAKRFEFLTLLTSGPQNIQKISEFIIENDLSHKAA